ncbi:MAG: SH3 domain-containing protein [Georgfuchsia sp.]
MRILAVLSLGFALAAPAFALDFRSVSDNAVLYDAPSSKGVKHFIIAYGTPVEVVLTQENWIKVRDDAGNMAWIEARLLSPLRTLLVRVDKADIRAEANDNSAIVFSAGKNVVLDLVEANPPGWAKVKHRDGQSGYVKASQVWGL